MGGDVRCLIFHGDVLTCPVLPECEIAVGNLPYRISAALVTRLLGTPTLRRIVLLVQTEFARRLLARPGELKYDRLSVLSMAMCETVRIIDRVPPEAFDPPPRVDSVVLELVPSLAGLPVPFSFFDRMLRIVFARAARGLSLRRALIQDPQLPDNWRAVVGHAGLVGDSPAHLLGHVELLAFARKFHSLTLEASSFAEGSS